MGLIANLLDRIGKRRPKPVPKPPPTPVPAPPPSPPFVPTPSPTPTPSPSNPVPADLIYLLNVERAKAGIAPLASYDPLNAFSLQRAQAMAASGVMSHAGFDRISAVVPGTSDGENIAEGYTTLISLVSAWMSDAGHRDNILGPNFRRVGVGWASSAAGPTYYACDLSS